jgi:hypothetical protein
LEDRKGMERDMTHIRSTDIQSKVEELEEINQSLRNRDKLKDDAISQLSDQLVALSTRLQEIERRQQLVT